LVLVLEKRLHINTTADILVQQLDRAISCLAQIYQLKILLVLEELSILEA